MSTTITIRSRCHLHKGRWIPEHERGPVTVTVPSRCHEHTGAWTPEAEGLLATIARAEGRPGQCAVGMRPVEPGAHYARAMRRHWSFGRCRFIRSGWVSKEYMLSDHAFGLAVLNTPERLCRDCSRTWKDHHAKGRAA